MRPREPQHGLVPIDPPQYRGGELYRAWEKLAYLIMEMEELGYTFHEGRSTVAFTCEHGKDHQITMSRTLKAYRDEEWENVIPVGRYQHRRGK